MSDSLDTSIMPMCNRDLEPVKRNGIFGETLIVGHLHAVVGHTRVILAGGRGSLRREQRQHSYYDSDNHPLDTHVGLPDLGLEWWIPNNDGLCDLISVHGQRSGRTCGETIVMVQQNRRI